MGSPGVQIYFHDYGAWTKYLSGRPCLAIIPWHSPGILSGDHTTVLSPEATGAIVLAVCSTIALAVCSLLYWRRKTWVRSKELKPSCGEGDCFCKQTLFQLAEDTFVTYEALHVGSIVRASFGKDVQVVAGPKVVNPGENKFVRLQTLHAQLDVTQGTNIPVWDETAKKHRKKRAGSLKDGDFIFVMENGVGAKCEQLTKDPTPYTMKGDKAQAVRIWFDPEEAVPCFLLPGSRVCAMGEPLEDQLSAVLPEPAQPLQWPVCAQGSRQEVAPGPDGVTGLPRNEWNAADSDEEFFNRRGGH